MNILAPEQGSSPNVFGLFIRSVLITKKRSPQHSKLKRILTIDLLVDKIHRTLRFRLLCYQISQFKL